MLRKEVFNLKLTLVLVHGLMLLNAVNFFTLFDGIYGMISINVLTFILLFVVHGYTYLTCKKLNVAKEAHLIAAVSIMLQSNIWLHVIAFIVLIFETYQVFKNKPVPTSPVAVSQK